MEYCNKDKSLEINTKSSTPDQCFYVIKVIPLK